MPDGWKNDLDTGDDIVAREPEKTVKYKLEIQIVGENTIKVRRLIPTEHRVPKELHPGEREPETLQTYEFLKSLVGEGTSEYEVPRLAYIEIKPFDAGARMIEAGEVVTRGPQVFEEIVLGGFMTTVGIAFERLRELGPGKRYEPRRW